MVSSSQAGTILDNHTDDAEVDEEYQLPLRYEIERAMYGVAIVLGVIAATATIRKFQRCCGENRSVAARLLSYKISLSVADALILFIYAPTQFLWISTFWWYGGDVLCRFYKFTTTFAFYLTGNMQVLIAFDRLVTMTHLTEVNTKGNIPYNSHLFLLIAWFLAFFSSIPQLLIFKLIYVNDDSDTPQCSSIWKEYSVLFEEEQERRRIIRESGNWTVISLPNNSSIRNEWIRMQEWEKMYNIVHISLMCIAPYLLELIIYALIISILSDAKKGEFSGFRRFVHKKILRTCQSTKKNDRMEQVNSLSVAVIEDPHTDSPVHSKQILTRRPSKSANSSPTRERHLDFGSPFLGPRRMTIAVDAQGVSSSIDRRSRPLAARTLSRSATHPHGKRNEASPREARETTIPWVQTVTTVRRNAKRKAFLMLSFNLIFWLPYCVHAIMSSFVEIDYVYFQFASALVVFNAITNILL